MSAARVPAGGAHPFDDFDALIRPLCGTLRWRLRMARAWAAHHLCVASGPLLAVASAAVALTLVITHLDDVHEALASWRFLGPG